MSIAEILIIACTAIHIDTLIQQIKSILTGSSVTAGSECTGPERECKIFSRIFRCTVHGYFTGIFIPHHFISPGLANIREVDAIVHVVRCFDDGNIVHVDGSVNPLRDIETINFELIFSDIEVLDRRIAKSTKGSRNDKSLAHEVEFLSKVKAHLEDGKLAKTFEVDDEEDQEILNSCNLLTIKPVIFAANVNEDELAGEDNDYVKAVREYAADVDAKVFVVCAQIEQEISELDDDEKKEFLEDLGLEESGLEKLISASYSLLGLISFLTSGEDETRAWTIKEGTKAPQAAGKIHTDFERGFICAEVVSFEDLKEYGTMQACKEKGLVRQEGKEYVVKDGDIIVFRFNV